ncbi:MAG: acyl-CoA-binding protein [Deltaproteobacteria bacterium]|nr:acyl-CoA-binding protein [Deltaproteobacteria bacterium]
MSDLAQRFADAQERVKTLPERPDNDTLLELYALYKQGSAGDASGKRPGMMDFVARAKFDQWAKKKGTSKDDAMNAYVALVDKLLAAAK